MALIIHRRNMFIFGDLVVNTGNYFSTILKFRDSGLYLILDNRIIELTPHARHMAGTLCYANEVNTHSVWHCENIYRRKYTYRENTTYNLLETKHVVSTELWLKWDLRKQYCVVCNEQEMVRTWYSFCSIEFENVYIQHLKWHCFFLSLPVSSLFLLSAEYSLSNKFMEKIMSMISRHISIDTTNL